MSDDAFERLRDRSDLFSGLFFVAVGGVFAFASRNYPFGSADDVGPGYMPMTLSGLLIVLGLAQLAVQVRRWPGKRVARMAEATAERRLMLRAAFCVTLALVLFAATVTSGGLVVAIPLLVGTAAFAEDSLSWTATAVMAAVLTVAVAVVFVMGFGVSLPILPAFAR